MLVHQRLYPNNIGIINDPYLDGLPFINLGMVCYCFTHTMVGPTTSAAGGTWMKGSMMARVVYCVHPSVRSRRLGQASKKGIAFGRGPYRYT